MIAPSTRRFLLISAGLLAVITLIFGLSGTRFLKGSLLDDRVLILADISPRDGVLSVREMRTVIVAEIAAITTNATNYQAAYDLNNSGAVDHADLVMLGQSLRAFLGAVCRNGIVEAGEQCDDNNASNNDFCTNVCKNAACGDTFVQGAEQCDDGNQINTDSCSNTCVAARCGDGILQSGEQCDDGNVSQTDSCMNTCTIPVSDTSIEQFCADNTVSGSLNGMNESAFNYPSTVTFNGEAFAGVGVIGTKTAGTIYRSVRQNNIGRWLKEAQFSAVPSSSYANIRFFPTANHLVATLEPSGTGSMMLTRQQNGQWTNVSFQTPTALRIGSVVEKEGKLYLSSLNNGMVYRHDGGRVWTPIATAISALKDIATLNDTLYAISVTNLYRYDGVSWVNVPIQGLPFANATIFATVFQMVAFGDALFVGGVDGEMQKSMVFKFDPVALFTPATKMQVGNPPTGMSQLMLHAAGNSLVAGAYSSPTQFSSFRYVPASSTWTMLSTVSYSQGKSFNHALVTLQSAVTPTPMWYVTCAKATICGDGLKEGTEQCDDGNTTDSDQCTNACMTNFCGDGIMQAARGEQCDDANTTENDACSNACMKVACDFNGDGDTGDGFARIVTRPQPVCDLRPDITSIMQRYCAANRIQIGVWGNTGQPIFDCSTASKTQQLCSYDYYTTSCLPLGTPTCPLSQSQCTSMPSSQFCQWYEALTQVCDQR